jgi:Rps23 Pro-64 3,4-dihydroxylase Tpa1-like proline 4-hydroxylase
MFMNEIDIDLYRSLFKSALPYPHSVIDSLWRPKILGLVAEEVCKQKIWIGEKNHDSSTKKRWQSSCSEMGNNTSSFINYLNGPTFLQWLERLTGECSLIPDPYLEGGGIHSTGNGGFLKLHTDFNFHSKLKLYRRLNVLIYLNKDWQRDNGGQLQFARSDGAGRIIPEVFLDPVFNRTVIFITDENTYHGHPVPVQVSGHVRRNSIALYYYQSEPPVGNDFTRRTGTNYVR